MDEITEREIVEAAAEPMAMLKYDFSFGGHRIKGEVTIDTVSEAIGVRDKLNAEYGDGSHWVEPLNETKQERAYAALSAARKVR